jgi:hypothetical protein
MEIPFSELDSYFARLTGGKVKSICTKIPVRSMRAAWEYIESHDITIVG